MDAETSGEIKIGERGRKQLAELIAAIERAQEQANTYIAGLVAGLDVPEGWQLNTQIMAFLPPPAPPAEPATDETGGDDATE